MIILPCDDGNHLKSIDTYVHTFTGIANSCNNLGLATVSPLLLTHLIFNNKLLDVRLHTLPIENASNAFVSSSEP